MPLVVKYTQTLAVIALLLQLEHKQLIIYLKNLELLKINSFQFYQILFESVVFFHFLKLN
jgi:hypothetical protein